MEKANVFLITIVLNGIFHKLINIEFLQFTQPLKSQATGLQHYLICFF